METEVGRGWKGVAGAGMTRPTSFNGLFLRLKGLCLFLKPPIHPFLFLLFPLVFDLTLVWPGQTPLPLHLAHWAILCRWYPGVAGYYGDLAGPWWKRQAGPYPLRWGGGQLHPVLPVHLGAWGVLFLVNVAIARQSKDLSPQRHQIQARSDGGEGHLL